MSESNPSAPVQGAASAAPATAEAGKTGPSGDSSGYSSMTTISSVGQLKEVAPDVYNAMMQGIATTICNDMKEHQDRIKKIMREASRDAEGKG